MVLTAKGLRTASTSPSGCLPNAALLPRGPCIRFVRGPDAYRIEIIGG